MLTDEWRRSVQQRSKRDRLQLAVDLFDRARDGKRRRRKRLNSIGINFSILRVDTGRNI